MSIKDLFNKRNYTQISKAVPIESASVQAEGTTMIEAKRKQFDRFVPPINFATASEYAKFGSAELYFENGFKRIYQEYPYDGTLAEKIEFENSSSYLDKYIFDNLYPRTNGYAVFSVQGPQHSAYAAKDWASPTIKEYIYVQGGPHTASAGMAGKPLHDTFDNSMLYDVVSGSKKGSSLETNMVSGSTVEFWMKKDTFLRTNHRQVVFDMWNGIRFQDDNDDYGRMTLYLSRSTNAGDPSFVLTLRSGSKGFDNLRLGATQASSSIIDGQWHHYAITMQSASQSSLKVELYIDGDLDFVTGSNRSYIPEVPIKTKGLVANIGALVTSSLDNANTRLGDGKLSASLDEFRFWKTARTPEQIHHTWNIPIGGGTNKHDSNKDLGVYFKFNEGVTGVSSTDTTVLDYSGRIANGKWTGYASGSRKTTSALVESGKVAREFKDPIIYSYHPDVTASIRQHRSSGSLYDRSKSSMFYNLFPAWMQETDTQDGQQLKILSQIIASYFDTLWHQIDFMNKIHDKQYTTGSSKPLPFAKKLLESRGFMMPELFVDAEISEIFLGKNDSHVFEKDLSDIKNLIYQNIYNNLDCIYKTKGTEKSFRNFFRSVGINSELVKLRMYADDSTYVLRDNYRNVSYEKNYLNFNTEFNTAATIFQSSASVASSTFIHTGSTEMNKAFTLETEIVLPLKNNSFNKNYFQSNFLTASIVGFTTAKATAGDYSFESSGSRDIHLIVARDKYDSRLFDGARQTIRFGVSSSHNSIGVQYGPRIKNQYDDNKWNLSLSFKDTKYPFGGFVSGSSVTPDSYEVTLYGIETEGTIIKNEFNSSLVRVQGQPQFVTDRKRVYAGAFLTAATGSQILQTDIKLGSVRYWRSFLPTGAVAQHAFDPESYGTRELYKPDFLLNSSASIPVSETLVLHWGFNNITGSDSDGEFMVSDLSSGSFRGLDSLTRYGAQDTRLLKSMHMGKGYGFLANSTSSISKEYLYATKKSQPDDMYSSDLVRVHSEATENFFTDDDVSDNFYSFEKSLYGTISQEMLNMFSSVKDFSNLIGQPNQRYHSQYAKLNHLKEIFFEDVENNPDIEKFTRFYKWIDDSISKAIEQLVPASARFSDSINNMVESHMLERNKYTHKVGLLTRRESTEGSIKGMSELLYDWKEGHAPIGSENQRKNCLWWADRAKAPFGSESRTQYDDSINTIRDVINNHSLQSAGLTRRQLDGTAYFGSTYAIRKLAKPYNFQFLQRKTIHGGVNYHHKINKFFLLDATQPFGTQGSVPNNVITVGVGAGTTGISTKQLCDENRTPVEKFRFGIEAEAGKFSNDYEHSIKGNTILPLNFISGTVHTGYNKETKRNYRSDVVITNLHSDITDIQNDIPMQGPFTETHVGGHQSRHVSVNRYDTSKSTTRFDFFVGGAAATGLIRMTSSVANFIAGDHIRVQDFDQTEVIAEFDTYFDMYNSKWRDFGDLKQILENKLDLTATRAETIPSDIPASGTFSISGAYVPAVADEGKFTLTTTHFPGTRATGKFTVTGAVKNKVGANGSFEVVSQEYHSTLSDSLKVGNNKGGTKYYALSDGTTPAYGGDLVRVNGTGSSADQFYSNLRTALNVNNFLTSSYVANSGTYANHIIMRKRTASAIRSSAVLASTGDAAPIATGSWSLNFWVKLDAAAAGDKRQIYFESSSVGNHRGRDLYVDVHGNLVFHTNARSNVDPEVAVTDSWVYNDFLPTYREKQVNVTLVHSGTFNISSAATLYIDGYKKGWDSFTAGGVTEPLQNFCNRLFLMNSCSLDAAMIGDDGTSRSASLGQLIILTGSISKNEVEALYNGAQTLKSSDFASPGLYDLISSSSIKHIYQFDDHVTHGNFVNSFGIGGSTIRLQSVNVLNTLTRSYGAASALVQGPVFSVLPHATFTVAPTSSGPQYNTTFVTGNVNTTRFTPVTNITGGFYRGAIEGARITVDGKNFIFTDGAPSDASPNYFISNTGSSTQIWNALAAGIVEHTNVGTVNQTADGNIDCVFRLTASAVGTGGNSAMSAITGNRTSADSFVVQNAMSGGLATSGSVAGDKIVFSGSNGQRISFILDGSNTSNTSTEYYIQHSGGTHHNSATNNGSLWAEMSENILAHTAITEVNISMNPTYAVFHLTSSHSSSLVTFSLIESGSSFSALSNVQGGNLVYGTTSGSFIQFSGSGEVDEDYKIVITTTAKSDAHPNLYVANTGSTVNFWEAIQHKMDKFSELSITSSVVRQNLGTSTEKAVFTITGIPGSGGPSNNRDFNRGGSFHGHEGNMRGFVDMSAHRIDTLRLTLDEVGTAGNSRVISSSAGDVVQVVTFAGGANASSTGTRRLYLDDSSNRPEAFGIVMKEHPVLNDADGAFGIVPADYGTTTHGHDGGGTSTLPFNIDKPRATRYRDEHAKRPLNVRNIQYNTASSVAGNFRKGYEIVSLDASTQRRWYRDNLSISLPSSIDSALPTTTNYLTFLHQTPFGAVGNIFGVDNATIGSTPNATAEFVSGRHPDGDGNTNSNSRVTSSAHSQATGHIAIDYGSNPANGPATLHLSHLYIFRGDGVRNVFTFSTTETNASMKGSLNYERYVRITGNDNSGYWGSTMSNFLETINTMFGGELKVKMGLAKYGEQVATASWEAAINAGSTIFLNFEEVGRAGADGNRTNWFGGAHTGFTNTYFSGSYNLNGGITAFDLRQVPDRVIEVPRTDKSGSSTYEIKTRFSAPGGPEVQTVGYLDAISHTFSPHSVLNYRNLTVLNDSGEPNAIRVVDHLNKRRGLKSLLSVHQGKGGLDSEFLTVLTSSNYGISGSYVKQHRNTFKVPQYSGDSIITGSRHDNGYFNSILPRSEFQYGWINKSTSNHRDLHTGSVLHLSSSSALRRQRIIGYAPSDGIVAIRASGSINGGTVLYEEYPIEAISFPSGSKIFSN